MFKPLFNFTYLTDLIGKVLLCSGQHKVTHATKSWCEAEDELKATKTNQHKDVLVFDSQEGAETSKYTRQLPEALLCNTGGLQVDDPANLSLFLCQNKHGC